MFTEWELELLRDHMTWPMFPVIWLIWAGLMIGTACFIAVWDVSQ